MTTSNKSVKLNTGASMPIVGLGTFLSKPGEVGESVKAAVKAGYRSIDCAEAYDNQKEIGEAFAAIFKEGHVKREDLFITSKLRNTKMRPELIEKQLDQTLADLQLQYLDLYLLHQPVSANALPNDKFEPVHEGFGMQDIWRKMEEIQKSGKARAIGISNFPTILVNDILSYAKVKPAVNQIERHPYLVQQKHVEFCKKHGVQVTAYAPLGAPGSGSDKKDNPPLLEHKVVKEIAKKHNKSPAQVLIRWSVDHDVITIPKSVKKERVEENWNVFDFELSKDELKELDKLDLGLRYFDQDWHGVPTFT